MTKINLNDEIIGFDNKPISGENGKNATFKSICQIALWQSVDQTESAQTKYENYKLSRKIDVEGEVELTTEEIVKLKDKVGKVYGTLLVGLTYDKLEGIV